MSYNHFSLMKKLQVVGAIVVLILLGIGGWVAVQYSQKSNQPSLFQTSGLKNFDNLTLDDLPNGYFGLPICGAALVGQTVWVSPRCNRVLKYDLNGKMLAMSDPGVASSVAAIVPVGNWVFLKDWDRGLVKVDSTAETVTHVYDLPEAKFLGANLIPGKKYLWMTDTGTQIWRINPMTDQITPYSATSVGFDPSVRHLYPVGIQGSQIYFEDQSFSPILGKALDGIAMYDENSDAWSFIPATKIADAHIPENISLKPYATINQKGEGGSGIAVPSSNSYFNIAFNVNGTTTTVPIMIRQYYAYVKTDSDTYYLASSAGIDKLSRGDLQPTIVAQTDPSLFPTGVGESHMLLSPSGRYVVHLAVVPNNNHNISGYNALVYDLQTHQSVHTYAKQDLEHLSFVKEDAREFPEQSLTQYGYGYVVGTFGLQEAPDHLTVTLDGQRRFDAKLP